MAGLCSNAPGCCAVQEGSTGQTELNAYKKSIEILHNGNKKSLPNVELSSDTWRRRWDSNPRDIAVKLISSFLVYIETDGICRKKAEVVGR